MMIKSKDLYITKSRLSRLGVNIFMKDINTPDLKRYYIVSMRNGDCYIYDLDKTQDVSLLDTLQLVAKTRVDLIIPLKELLNKL